LFHGTAVTGVAMTLRGEMWSSDKGQKGTHQVLGDMIIHYPNS